MGRGGPSQFCCSFLLVGGHSPTSARRPSGARAEATTTRGPSGRTLRVRLGARLPRAVCGSASSPQTPSSAPGGRRAPLARAAATFRRLQEVFSLSACGLFSPRNYLPVSATGLRQSRNPNALKDIAGEIQRRYAARHSLARAPRQPPPRMIQNSPMSGPFGSFTGPSG